MLESARISVDRPEMAQGETVNVEYCYEVLRSLKENNSCKQPEMCLICSQALPPH